MKELRIIALWFSVVMLLFLVGIVHRGLTDPRRLHYIKWWRETIACAGEHGVPMNRPEVIVVDSIPGEGYPAVAELQSRRVYVIPAYADSEGIIKHEFLHIIVGRPGHPAIPFAICGPRSSAWRVYGYDE